MRAQKTFPRALPVHTTALPKAGARVPTKCNRELLLDGRARRVRQLVAMLEGTTAAERAALHLTVSTLQRLLKQPAG